MTKRGLIGRLLNHLTKWKGVGHAREIRVGEDANGNEYFIRHADGEGKVREARWVEPSQDVTNEFHDQLTMNIPQEWDAWLRKRRKDPPTVEEIHRNLSKQMQIRQRVQRLNQLEKVAREGSEGDQHNSLAQDISGDTSKRAFPKYDEYEISPGQRPSMFKAKK